MMSENDRQGAGGLAELVRSVADLAPDALWRDDSLAVRGDRHRLGRFTVSGHEQHGGAWEIAALLLMVVDEQGRNAHSEIFDLEDEAAARTRLDELAGPHALTLGPLAEPGGVTDGAARWAAAHNAHDLEAIAEILAEDYHYEDRRPLIAHSGDRAAIIESWRMAHGENPDLQYDLLALAVSGEVSLASERWSDSLGSFAVELDTVARWDQRGRLRAAWVYEPGESAAWEKYLELTGPTAAPAKPLVRRVGDRWVEAFRARDFEAVAALYAPAAVFIDHRPISGPEVSGEQAVTQQAATLVQLAADTVHEGDPMEAAGEHHGLGRNRFVGTHEHGGEWAIELLTILEVDVLGRITRVELFSDEQETKARQRLAELVALTPRLSDMPAAELAADEWWPHVKHLRALAESMNRPDIDGLRDLIDEDFRQVDNRPLGAGQVDRDGFVEMVGGAPDVMTGVRFGYEILEVRGDARAATVTFTGEAPEGGGPAALSFYAVTRMRGGRMISSVIYGSRRRRWRRSSAALSPRRPNRVPAAEEFQRRYVAAFNARDWKATELMLAEDLVQVDRRVMGTEMASGREAAMATLHSSVDVAPDLVLESRTIAASDDAIAAILTFRGTTPDGGPAELRMGYLGIRRGGEVFHNEYFEADGEDAILVQYESWVAHLRQARTFARPHQRADWDRLREIYDDALQPDRLPRARRSHDRRRACLRRPSAADVRPGSRSQGVVRRRRRRWPKAGRADHVPRAQRGDPGR